MPFSTCIYLSLNRRPYYNFSLNCRSYCLSRLNCRPYFSFRLRCRSYHTRLIRSSLLSFRLSGARRPSLDIIFYLTEQISVHWQLISITAEVVLLRFCGPGLFRDDVEVYLSGIFEIFFLFKTMFVETVGLPRE